MCLLMDILQAKQHQIKSLPVMCKCHVSTGTGIGRVYACSFFRIHVLIRVKPHNMIHCFTCLYYPAGGHSAHTDVTMQTEPLIPREDAADQIPVDMTSSSAEMLGSKWGPAVLLAWQSGMGGLPYSALTQRHSAPDLYAVWWDEFVTGHSKMLAWFFLESATNTVHHSTYSWRVRSTDSETCLFCWSMENSCRSDSNVHSPFFILQMQAFNEARKLGDNVQERRNEPAVECVS